MQVQQLSVFVENKSGRLAEITEAIAKAGVDIRALTIADTRDFGILRLIVDDPRKAEDVLREAGMTVSITSVLMMGLSDRPGEFAKAMRVLADNAISVEYMYAFLGGKDVDHAYMIFRVQDHKAAAAALGARGIRCVDQDEIAQL